MASDGSHSSSQNVLGEAVNSLVEGNKVFDRYTLMKVMGRSRTSVVWKAWDERLGRDVALKFLPGIAKADASALATLKSAVKKLQELKHPAIVSIDNVENEGPLVAVVSDFVDGQSLTQVREQKSDLVFAPGELKDWLQQLCSMLAYGHGEGRTPHGALKPSNLLVDQKGALRVTDFGLERVINEFVARTTDVKDAGRELVYLSPQVANGESVNWLDDIYSFGASLYELLTSRPPFYTGDLMLQLQQKVPPPMTHRRKELRVIGEPIPRVWEEAVAACLAKDPGQRPQTIEKVEQMLDLKRATDELPVEAAPAAPAHKGANPVMIAGVVMVFVVVAVAAVVLGKKKPEPVSVAQGTGAQGGGGLSQEAMAELEAKRKQAEESLKEAQKAAKDQQLEAEKNRKEAERLLAEAEKVKKAQEQALLAAKADAERAKAKADADRKKAEAELAQKIKDLAKAQQAAKADSSEGAQKAAREAEAILAKARADAERLAADAAMKRKEEEAKLLKLEAERKRAEEMAEAQRLAAKAQQEAAARLAADAERRRLEVASLNNTKMLAEAKARREAEEKTRREADEKARREAEERAKAEMARRRFSPGTKVWFNSLAMKFVPVGTVYFCATETRLADFETFFRATRHDAGKGWTSPGFSQSTANPVVNVSWNDAQAFCKWLTEKEQKEGLISNLRYRLPTDAEWSQAVGLQGEAGGTPAERDQKIKGTYPWGTQWPPAVAAGNYPDSLSYDPFDKTAPVASFHANAFGLYDMGGNVWEWCEDWSDGSQKNRVVRGGSWFMNLPASLYSSYRRQVGPSERSNEVGFRVVLSQ